MLYEVEVTFYRDCGGVAEPQNITINCRSTNGSANLSLIAMKKAGYGNEITVPCANSPTNCSGGSGTGIRQWKYAVQVTLPSQQTDWIFSYSICCRNCAITTISNPCAANSVLYVEAKLNNINGSCNSSPVFSNNPLAYVCLGQNFNYNHGVLDADGDSLVYSLITPKTSSTTNVNFIPPFTTNTPLATSTPFILDPITGDLNFTPSQIQIGVMAILINEFRNGTWIGSVTRDMQVYVSPCSNALPRMSGINGTGNYSTQACAGTPVCFAVNSTDTDTTQSLIVTTNNGINAASYQVGTATRPTLNFCWTPTATDEGKTKSFTVTVRDDACPSNGVQIFAYHIMVRNKLKLSSTPSVCNTPSGSASVVNTASGTQYFWSNGATSSSINNLTAGLYTISVAELYGCVQSDTIRVNSSGFLLVNATNASTCLNSCNGSLQIQASGGAAPYQFVWQNGNQTAQLNQLCTGNYSVHVTDGSGCAVDSNFTISAIAPVSISFVTTNAACGASGKIQAIISGGILPYSQVWNQGATTTTISQLSAGNYTLMVTDSAGCSTNATATIVNDSSTLSLTTSRQDITCLGLNDGSINLNISSGTSPYQYLWSNGATTSTIMGLSAGIYTVIASDANGCSTSVTDSILAPLKLQVTHVLTLPDCRPTSGAITLTVSGGIAPYSYLWSNGTSASSIQNINAGNYKYTVTDAHGCTQQDSLILISQNNFSAPYTSSPATCFGNSDGVISIQPTGGIAPYSFLWQDGNTQAVRQNIHAGNYSIDIHDAAGCLTQLSITIKEPAPLQITKTVTQPNCLNGILGSIQLIPSGGVTPYLITWSDSTTTLQHTNLMAGTYYFTLTDSNGCNSIDSILLIATHQLEIIALHSTTICMGEKATLSVSGSFENAPINWYYNGEILKGATRKIFETPVAGKYFAKLFTDCGEFISNEIEIKVELMQNVRISNNQLICPGEKAELLVSGGVSYQWQPAPGITDLVSERVSVTPEKTTTYTVIVTGADGCTAIASVEVAVICDNTDIPSGFSPNNDGVNDLFVIDGLDQYPENAIFIYNRWGNLVYHQKNYENTWSGTGNVSGVYLDQNLTDGTYYYILDLQNNQKPETGYVMIRR